MWWPEAVLRQSLDHLHMEFLEVMWIKKILEELKILSPLPMKAYCDNKTTILISHNPILHDKMKHVEVDKHFIKEKLDNGSICMIYIPIREQVSSILTKGLYVKQFDNLDGKLWKKPA